MPCIYSRQQPAGSQQAAQHSNRTAQRITEQRRITSTAQLMHRHSNSSNSTAESAAVNLPDKKSDSQN